MLGLLNEINLKDNFNSYIDIILPGNYEDETGIKHNILTSKFDIDKGN